MYVPVRMSGSDAITSVVEFYQLPDAIDREVGEARLLSWGLVAAVIGVSFLLLYGIVKQGSDTIGRQESALEQQVGELSELLAENSALSDKVRDAADRTMTLNERALRRISADLHDGPGQTVSLALIRFDALRATTSEPDGSGPPAELDEVESCAAGRPARHARDRGRPPDAGARRRSRCATSPSVRCPITRGGPGWRWR